LIRQYVRGLHTLPPERYVGLAPEQNNRMAGLFLRPLWLLCQSLSEGSAFARDQVSEK
jgi:hypothetical protein